jgi:hypothetical protein
VTGKGQRSGTIVWGQPCSRSMKVLIRMQAYSNCADCTYSWYKGSVMSSATMCMHH